MAHYHLIKKMRQRGQVLVAMSLCDEQGRGCKRNKTRRDKAACDDCEHAREGETQEQFLKRAPTVLAERRKQ